MKMNLLITILFSVFYLSCHSQKNTAKQTQKNSEKLECSEGIDFCADWLNSIIKPNWAEDEVGRIIRGEKIRCFTGSKEYWEYAIIANQFCLLGKPKEYIESILGIPNNQRESRSGNIIAKYSICDEKTIPVWHLQINYDKKLNVLNITEQITSID